MACKAKGYLNLDYELEILNFETINSLPTEIGSLFLDPKYRKKHFGRLLSYCRFFFIANFPSFFSTTIMAQLRGISDKTGCPFWNAVGNKFFGVSFDEADHLRVYHPLSIAELFPRSPIYPAMLPKKAQNVIRKPHKHTVPARLLLEKEGFQLSSYCDIFDAGPHMYASRDSIHTVKHSKCATLRIHPINKLDDYLISNTKKAFRATVAPLQILGDEIVLDSQTAALLDAHEGDTLRYQPL